MAVFMVVATQNAPQVLQEARRIFGVHFLQLTADSCIVAGPATAKDASEQIGLLRGSTGGMYLGSAVVTSVGSYFGVADPAIWDWIRDHWNAGGGLLG